MNLTVIMWILVGVSVAIAAAVMISNSAKARKAQAENAQLLLGRLFADFPDPVTSVDEITVTETAVTAAAKESSGLESRTYDFAELGIKVSGEMEMSQLTNYFLDALSAGEWTKTMNRGEAAKDEPAPVIGFTLTNHTRVMSEHFKVAPKL